MKRFFLGLFSLAVIAVITPVWAEDDTFRHTINVVGTGEVTTQPDAMSLSVGVQTRGKTVEAARSENAAKMNAVIQRIKALNVPHLTIQTTGFNVSPVWEEDHKTSKYKFYEASHSLSIKVEGETNADVLAVNAARILDTAMAAGANNTNGPNFYLSRNNTAQREALKLAIADSRQTAQVAAEAAGVKLTGIYTIETQPMYVPMRAMKSYSADSAMAAEAPTPIETGTFDVNTSVTTRFEFSN